MKHDAGKEMVRADEPGMWRVAHLARLRTGVEAQETLRLTIREIPSGRDTDNSGPSVIPRRDVGGANRAMDGSPTSLALAEAASAAILRCDDNNVRTAANCQPIQTNAITSENTPKHSSMKMFSLFGLSAPTT